jgi:hypothetical protein
MVLSLPSTHPRPRGAGLLPASPVPVQRRVPELGPHPRGAATASGPTARGAAAELAALQGPQHDTAIRHPRHRAVGHPWHRGRGCHRRRLVSARHLTAARPHRVPPLRLQGQFGLVCGVNWISASLMLDPLYNVKREKPSDGVIF